MPDHRPCHCGNTVACPDCWLAANSEPHRAKWGITGPLPPPPESKNDCRSLGPVVEFCTSCGDREERNVHACYHDSNPTEKCTIGVVSDLVWSCRKCPHYSPPAARE